MEGPRAPISAGCEEEAGRREERAKEADLAERRSTYDDERRKRASRMERAGDSTPVDAKSERPTRF